MFRVLSVSGTSEQCVGSLLTCNPAARARLSSSHVPEGGFRANSHKSSKEGGPQGPRDPLATHSEIVGKVAMGQLYLLQQWERG